MSEQRFDLGLSETAEAPAGVTLRPILQVNEVAVLPAGHALCRKAVLSPQDFEGERFVSLAAGDSYRAQIDQMFASAQVTRQTRLEAASAVVVCAMVRQGLGLAIVNPLTALAMAGPDLVVRPLSVAIAFKVSLLLPEVAAPHPLQAALVAAVTQAARELAQAARAGSD